MKKERIILMFGLPYSLVFIDLLPTLISIHTTLGGKFYHLSFQQNRKIKVMWFPSCYRRIRFYFYKENENDYIVAILNQTEHIEAHIYNTRHIVVLQ